MPAPAPAVLLDGLVMRYGDKTAVDDLSLTVERGLDHRRARPQRRRQDDDAGDLRGLPAGHSPGGCGCSVSTRSRDRRDLLPRIGVMLQAGGAWSGVRAMEMLRHIASLHAHPLDTAMLAERLGLGDCGRTPYRRLSGGQQQRLGLAMAVVGRPELVFVDEPTAGMDPAARRTTWELLSELRADGVTVVLTTHYMEEAERLADRIHIIDRGRLIASGSPAELTRGGSHATIRLVVTEPYPPSAPASLQAALRAGTEVTPIDAYSLLVSGPADSSTLGVVSRWCEEHGVLPESLNLGQRNLEDVFLELTGRGLVP